MPVLVVKMCRKSVHAHARAHRTAQERKINEKKKAFQYKTHGTHRHTQTLVCTIKKNIIYLDGIGGSRLVKIS